MERSRSGDSDRLSVSRSPILGLLSLFKRYFVSLLVLSMSFNELLLVKLRVCLPVVRISHSLFLPLAPESSKATCKCRHWKQISTFR